MLKSSFSHKQLVLVWSHVYGTFFCVLMINFAYKSSDMPSFDIVSKVEQQALDNAINVVMKEITNRFDFKNSHVVIDLDKKEFKLNIETDDEMKMGQLTDVLVSRAHKQGISPEAFDFSKEAYPSGKVVKKQVSVRNGLNQEDAKKITRLIKESGIKVQAQIMDAAPVHQHAGLRNKVSVNPIYSLRLCLNSLILHSILNRTAKSVHNNQPVMKKDIHPQGYRVVVFKDMTNGTTFLTRSTTNTRETIKFEDGNEYPLVKLEISSTSHPFFTGQKMLVDTAGRIDKFRSRYEKK